MAKFSPNYTLTNTITKNLLQIEQVKEKIKGLPINPQLLTSLRRSARLSSVHYSTQIEGNRLSQEEVSEILDKHIKILRELDSKQKRVLELFEAQKFVTANDIADFFRFSPRSARLLLKNWVDEGFVLPLGQSRQRKYCLVEKYEEIIR